MEPIRVTVIFEPHHVTAEVKHDGQVYAVSAPLDGRPVYAAATRAMECVVRSVLKLRSGHKR